MFRNFVRLLVAILLPPFIVIASQFAASSADAHDSWINRGGFRGPLNGEWCCGEHDCVIIPAALVRINKLGYALSMPRETVPYAETLPSLDGQYWRCHRRDGSRRCFFAPQFGY